MSASDIDFTLSFARLLNETRLELTKADIRHAQVINRFSSHLVTLYVGAL